MKKNLLAVVLPVAAFVALAGTGFGAWVFTTGAQSADVNANVLVTDAVTVGDIKAVAGGVITLDQAENSFGNPTLNVKVDYTAIAGYANQEADGDLAIMDPADNTAVKFDLKYTVSYAGGVDTYIKATKIGDNNLAENTVTVSKTNVTADLDETLNVTFAWQNRPTDVAGYNAMITELKDAKITYTVEILNLALAA